MSDVELQIIIPNCQDCILGECDEIMIENGIKRILRKNCYKENVLNW